MANKNIDSYIPAFGISLMVTSLLSALLVLVKETNKPVKAWMEALTGHHWTTHGVLVLGLFVVLGLVLARIPSAATARFGADARAVAAAVIVSGLIIAGFYPAEL